MIKKYLSIFIIMLLVVSNISFADEIDIKNDNVKEIAHSGRTDSNGGHKDNKNKSGLGSYHYHCGGYPAHLHSNGVCPYSSSSKPSTAPTTTPAPKKQADLTAVAKAKIIDTDIRVLIGENEIPAYIYKDNDFTKTVIIAEDLKNYGCDVSWNQEKLTLTIDRNYNKEIVSMDIKKSKTERSKSILKEVSDLKLNVVINDSENDISYSPEYIYNLNGYIAIGASDLAKIFGEYVWNNAERTITLVK